ncbi:MAG TPA: 50S ribosomal protein L5 [Armatimonadaceae bacterium]|nr:50S ribosomal protein L5 [Armatimonadaceae bacterium]
MADNKNTPAPNPRLKEHYLTNVVPAVTKQFNYTNPMQVPRIEKVIVNMGVGQAGQTGGDPKLLDNAIRDMTIITGQKPVVTTAKKSIANFRLRAGARIGCKVTLRGVKMYEFLDRLFNVTLPRVRDFQGINPNSFDGRGNFAMGMKEQLVFPEIDYDKIDKIRGMDIIIVTTSNTDEEARYLLMQMGLPFRQTAQSGPGGATRMV